MNNSGSDYLRDLADKAPLQEEVKIQLYRIAQDLEFSIDEAKRWKAEAERHRDTCHKFKAAGIP